MSQAVTVYRWDDAGAPQLTNGKPSELIDILNKCLVTGYGSKSPLGWTMPFYEPATQSVVFRNNPAVGGSGGYVKLYSNTAADANNTPMRLTYAQTVSDINTFFGQGNVQSVWLGTNMTRWVIIGTAIGFYLTIDQSTPTLKMTGPSNFGTAAYIGDFYSSIPSDAGRFIAFSSFWNATFSSSASEDSLYYMRAANDSLVRTPFKIYDADGFNGSRDYTLNILYPGNTGGITNSVVLSEPTSNEILMPAFFWITNMAITSTAVDRLNVSVRDSTLSPTIRGTLPGYGYSLKVGYQNTTWPFTKSINGNLHWLLRSFIQGGYTSAGAFINMEQWNDPFGNI